MKKAILVVFTLIILVSLVAACGAKLPPKDKIVIGQSVSQSGMLAAGNAAASSPYYDLWVQDVNAAGGLYIKEYKKKFPVELRIYDDKSDVSMMSQQLEKLIVQEKVDFILPPWSTAMLFAAASIAQKYQYILIGGAGGAMKLKELDMPYFFQTLNFAETQVPVMADVLNELGIKKVAIVAIEDLHGIEYNQLAVPAFTQKGMEIVMNKTYPPDIKDASMLLKEAQNKGAEAFIGFSYPDDSMLITGTALELGINFKVFELTVCPAFDFYKGAFGPAVEGVMGGGAWNEKSSAGAKAFSEHYKAVTGKDIGNYWGSLYFYSAMQHFQQAVEEAGTLDQTKIRNLLAEKTYETALGKFWYDKRRIFINHPGEMGQWQNGVFEVIDPGERRTAPPIIKPNWPTK